MTHLDNGMSKTESEKNALKQPEEPRPTIEVAPELSKDDCKDKIDQEAKRKPESPIRKETPKKPKVEVEVEKEVEKECKIRGTNIFSGVLDSLDLFLLDQPKIENKGTVSLYCKDEWKELLCKCPEVFELNPDS
jgi:hypothetical protein